MQPDELKRLRKRAGLSQGQLAQKIGLSLGYVGEMERGEKPIDFRTAEVVRIQTASFKRNEYKVEPTNDGRFMVVHETLREIENPAALASFLHQKVLVSVFDTEESAQERAGELQAMVAAPNSSS